MTSLIYMQRADNALEKKSTASNPNLQWYDYQDAIEKGMNDWIRRQVHGNNIRGEMAEETTMKVDDLQPLLKTKKISIISGTKLYNDIHKLPEDYRYFNRLTPIVSKGKCSRIRIKSRLSEEANVDEYLRDWSMQPSFDFEETFHTMQSNKFRVYHNEDFKIEEVDLVYYRDPVKISCEKKNVNKIWEWKDDVAELIIDEAIKILAGEIEHSNAYELANTRVENNN